MLTVSPSISPLSYSSIFISPGGASMRFTSALVLLVSATGGGTTVGELFAILIGESILGVAVRLIFTSFVTTGFAVLVTAFLTGCFAGVDGFFVAAGFGAVVTGGG